VRGSGQPFRNEVSLASGKKVDLDRYGLKTVYGWHFLWLGLGTACSAYWLRKRFFPRLLAVRSGATNKEMVSAGDMRFVAGMGGLALILVVGSFAYSNSHYKTIPLQVRREAVPTMASPDLATATLISARYDNPTDTLKMDVEVRNKTESDVRVESLVMGPLTLGSQPFENVGRVQAAPGLRSVDSQTVGQRPNDGNVYVAPEAPIRAGQVETISLYLNGDLLNSNRLLFTNSAVNQVGGLLVLRDSSGQRGWVSLVADLIKY
jgi:hypothetical protein